jgi:hypothetical protein
MSKKVSNGSRTQPVITTIGRGRSVAITEYEVDPRDIEDMFRGKPHRPRPPVRVTYYKPTRAQHYHAIGRMYGVERKPGQSLRAYAQEVDNAVAAAVARHNLPKPDTTR